MGANPASEPRKIRVVAIDDDPEFLRTVARTLTKAGLDVEAVTEPTEGLVAALGDPVDVVLSDIQMPNLNGLELLTAVKARRPLVEVVLMTGSATVEAAVSAVKAGAYDYLTKPFDNPERVVITVCKAAEHKRLAERTGELEAMLQVKEDFEDFVGQSAKMSEIFKMVAAVAGSSASILLQGESGTGKELVARAIHRRSPRKGRSFIAVNCSALTETLLESELFGHVRGAFTGATVSKQGLFEAANQGTLFLDEIGDTPPSMQVRLLRAIQEGEIIRVGSSDAIHVDVRIVAATNVDLSRAVAEGRFREDLYYRLNVVAIELPPLRDRPEDIALLAQHFIQKFAKKSQKDVRRLSAEALSTLMKHAWPGNVRELENVVERAVVLAQGPEIVLGDLPQGLKGSGGGTGLDPGSLSHLTYSAAKTLALGVFERRYLADVLRRNQGSIRRAAEAAGIDRSNYRRLLKQFGVAYRAELEDKEDKEEGA